MNAIRVSRPCGVTAPIYIEIRDLQHESSRATKNIASVLASEDRAMSNYPITMPSASVVLKSSYCLAERIGCEVAKLSLRRLGHSRLFDLPERVGRSHRGTRIVTVLALRWNLVSDCTGTLTTPQRSRSRRRSLLSPPGRPQSSAFRPRSESRLGEAAFPYEVVSASSSDSDGGFA